MPIDEKKDQEERDREAMKQEAADDLRKTGKKVAEKYPKHASAETLADEAADRLEKSDE